ncbi:hypothetical protein QE152_g37515 [Popillia japonica]|uniref:Uncharacterized protein n=1 Tax=Popillia japonica TaxID=7064 RepID=A0AAW1IAA2_POPJA
MPREHNNGRSRSPNNLNGGQIRRLLHRDLGNVPYQELDTSHYPGDREKNSKLNGSPCEINLLRQGNWRGI